MNNAGIASRKLDLTKREKGVEALSKSMFDYPEDQWGSGTPRCLALATAAHDDGEHTLQASKGQRADTF